MKNQNFEYKLGLKILKIKILSQNIIFLRVFQKVTENINIGKTLLTSNGYKVILENITKPNNMTTKNTLIFKATKKQL